MDGRTHLRPLMTVNDLRVALNDITNPSLFRQGIVQLPLHITGESHKVDRSRFYRYIYQLNKEPIVVEFIKPATPNNNWGIASLMRSDRKDAKSNKKGESVVDRRWKSVREFICPYLCSALFEKRQIPPAEVPRSCMRQHLLP